MITCASPTRPTPRASVPPHRRRADAEFEALWNSAEEAAAGIIPSAKSPSRGSLPPGNSAREAEQLWLQVAKIPATRREALDALYAIYRADERPAKSSPYRATPARKLTRRNRPRGQRRSSRPPPRSQHRCRPRTSPSRPTRKRLTTPPPRSPTPLPFTAPAAPPGDRGPEKASARATGRSARRRLRRSPFRRRQPGRPRK